MTRRIATTNLSSTRSGSKTIEKTSRLAKSRTAVAVIQRKTLISSAMRTIQAKVSHLNHLLETTKSRSLIAIQKIAVSNKIRRTARRLRQLLAKNKHKEIHETILRHSTARRKRSVRRITLIRYETINRFLRALAARKGPQVQGATSRLMANTTRRRQIRLIH